MKVETIPASGHHYSHQQSQKQYQPLSTSVLSYFQLKNKEDFLKAGGGVMALKLRLMSTGDLTLSPKTCSRNMSFKLFKTHTKIPNGHAPKKIHV